MCLCWVQIARHLLEPIVTLVQITLLFELCQKDGKQADIRHWRKGEKSIASVYVDGQFVVSISFEQKENAELHAAKAAVQKLSYKTNEKFGRGIIGEVNRATEIEGAN